jgi:hypothetical protein
VSWTAGSRYQLSRSSAATRARRPADSPRPGDRRRAVHPSHAGPGAASLLALQSTAGNRAVETLLSRQIAGVGPDPVSKDVPGLPEHVLPRLEEHLAAGSASRAQAAIDLVVGILAARGEIDLALIEGRRMRFDPRLTDEGHTQQGARPARGGGFHPLPSTVRIGPPALTNASWLYTAIIHEYRHAEMFQTAQSDPFKEVDAYLHNIERADEAGLDGGEVLEIWGRVRDEWAEVPESLKPLYQERYDAAETTVRRIAGTTTAPTPPVGNTPVQRTRADGAAASTTTPKSLRADHRRYHPKRLDPPNVQRSSLSGGTVLVQRTTLVYEGSPGKERELPDNDPEFWANYVDNHIVLATGLCVPGTTWANIDHASVPEIRLTYRDGRKLVIAVADVPFVSGAVRKRAPMTTALRPLERYEKRSDGFIYPIRTVGGTPYVSYGDTSNIVSLRAGLHENIEELKRLFVLLELGGLFAGAIAALGGIGSLRAPNRGGVFRFTPRMAKRQGASVKGDPLPPKPTREPAASPKTPATRSGTDKTGNEPGPKTPPTKAPRPKAGKPGEGRPDRELTAGKSDKTKKAGKGESEGGEEQTAAERDWEKAQAEARKQNAPADKSTRTEHGAVREGERGALTPKEVGRLGSAVPHQQGDGATAKVVRQKGGRYLVHITNPDGETVTVIRDKTKAEVKGLSERYQWNPPWTE